MESMWFDITENEKYRWKRKDLTMKRKLIGQVGVDSGQLMVIDPCYISSEWKNDEKPIGIKFWGQGKSEVAVLLKEQGYEVVDRNSSFRIMFEDEEQLIELGMKINRLSSEIGKIVVHTPITESTYDTICDLTGSKNQAGQLNYQMDHSGLGVVFSSGLGDGAYDVYATYKDLGAWGERITKVEIVMIEGYDDEEEE